MKAPEGPNPVDFGNRVRERRNELGLSQTQLGKLANYRQTNIYWIEKGKPKRPHIQAEALAPALRTTRDYLLWGRGPKEIGPPVMNIDELVENYNALSPEDRAAISAAILERIGTPKKKRKSG